MMPEKWYKKVETGGRVLHPSWGRGYIYPGGVGASILGDYIHLGGGGASILRGCIHSRDGVHPFWGRGASILGEGCIHPGGGGYFGRGTLSVLHEICNL